jgi:hypothetical protein
MAHVDVQNCGRREQYICLGLLLTVGIILTLMCQFRLFLIQYFCLLQRNFGPKSIRTLKYFR